MTKLIIGFLLMLSSIQAAAQAADGEQAVTYLSYFSSQVVHRPLTATEVSKLRAGGFAAVSQIISPWFQDPEFVNSSQEFVENLMRTSGNIEGEDHDLPGNLGRDIARRSRPYADIITASSCVDGNGANKACDTGAPYAAGVLTTKAFLKGTKGAYNIARASKLVSKFLCSSYPLNPSEEPRLLAAELIPEFATTEGKLSFGNGNNCYSCHSQFGLHAQFFIKFDLNGNYKVHATGLQNPKATDGFASDGLLTSHLKDPARAGHENSRMLGRNVANLAEAAKIIAQSSRFLPCAVKNMLLHYVRPNTLNVASIRPDLYKQIADQAKATRSSPSLSHLISAIITNKHVFNSFKKSGALP